jgi:hypothetical protein
MHELQLQDMIPDLQLLAVAPDGSPEPVAAIDHAAVGGVEVREPGLSVPDLQAGMRARHALVRQYDVVVGAAADRDDAADRERRRSAAPAFGQRAGSPGDAYAIHPLAHRQ